MLCLFLTNELSFSEFNVTAGITNKRSSETKLDGDSTKFTKLSHDSHEELEWNWFFHSKNRICRTAG